MRLFEFKTDYRSKLIHDFTSWACSQLKINNKPQIQLIADDDFVLSNRTFGSTSPDGDVLVYLKNRNTADVLRTLCHELIHCAQFERGIAHSEMSEQQRQRIEDQANAIAGRMLRDYGKINGDIYEID
jgi:Zn-dependent peptidase ImmA (M78 family)